MSPSEFRTIYLNHAASTHDASDPRTDTCGSDRHAGLHQRQPQTALDSPRNTSSSHDISTPGARSLWCTMSNLQSFTRSKQHTRPSVQCTAPLAEYFSTTVPPKFYAGTSARSLAPHRTTPHKQCTQSNPTKPTMSSLNESPRPHPHPSSPPAEA